MNSHVSVDQLLSQRTYEPRRDAGQAAVRTLSSATLFQGTREIAIDHGESVYRLKITRQGKLILNK